MRVLVSALLVNTTPGKSFAGVGRFMFQFLNQLTLTPSENHYEVFIRDDQLISEEWRRCEWITWHQVPVKNSRARIWWEHFKLGFVARKLRCSAIVCTFVHLPLVAFCPIISFAHDAFPRTHGNWFPPRKRILLDSLTAHACRKSSIIVTVSEFSRKELSRVYGIAKSKIVVAPAGLGNLLPKLTAEEAKAICGDLLPKGRNIFTVGTLEPRKNLDGLIRGFALMKSLPGHDDVQLVIVGAKGWLDSDISTVVNESGFKDEIHFLGYVTDEQLNALMQSVELFALVSHVEGFGIPVLEAMTAGVPVVASNTGAIPEVIGDGAFYCTPSSPDSIADALSRGLADKDTAEQYVLTGLERSRTFTWETVVQKLNEALIIVTASN